ncbi:MAG: DNA-directed RNA polymerase subunit beta [Lentisphaeria bacterium]|nr:DNA-directed RNA polymerase subunit beta [Lentisphaeria bacterium]
MSNRISFGKLQNILAVPDLIGLQIDSYRNFLQPDVPPQERKNQGLQEVFNEIFPIVSYDGQSSVEFISYEVGKPKLEVVECIKDGKLYDAPLYVKFRFKRNDMEIVEDVYMGEIPIMTESGTFIINGAERVIISQLHRSPGICFEKARHTSGRTLYSYRIIPDRGSWMDVQFDINDYIYIYLDRRRRRRKFLITTFLRAIGYESNKDILENIYSVESHTIASLLKKDTLEGYYTIDKITNENDVVIIDELTSLTENHLQLMQENGIKSIELAFVPDGAKYIISCMKKDPARNAEQALNEIYRKMRPGDPDNIANAKLLVKRLFFDNLRYDLGTVGRFKINERLGLDLPLTERTLNKLDLLEATKVLIQLRHKNGEVDDIDHLGNRRVRTVGELLQNQCRAGLLRTERMVRERMTLFNSNEDTNITPGKLINPKSFSGIIRDFFARSQLSQFMDQINPLSELTNKRRLSALGPGGLSRDRAGFEVRDVHSSHYGRICPIETPEGPNIGLISSLALYSVINEYGFLETPYRKVIDGQVTDDVEFLTADQEEKYVIAQANALLDENNRFVRDVVMSRYQGESEEHPKEEVQYMDVSPKQLVSAAAGIIPFLEHDDANRALMGSNMQRQAVPVLMTDSPIVGTGLEETIARDSRAVIVAKEDGIVAAVSTNKILITPDGKLKESPSDPGIEYTVHKFLRSNAGCCINQRPIVRSGQVVKKGDVIADGAATQGGELALGRNVMVAYMPWCGYNFEDAIIVSERLVKEDVYTSIHIDEFEIISRETKLGPEEITRDIPNVSEDALRNLDSRGVVYEGAEVKLGDILVGKIQPKNETELAPEERLLHAIFGEKAADVKDASLTVSGKGGTVMDIRIEYSSDPNRQTMTKSEQRRLAKDFKDEYRRKLAELTSELTHELEKKILDTKLPYPIIDKTPEKNNAVLISSNRKVTSTSIQKLASHYNSWDMEDCPLKQEISAIIAEYIPRFEENEEYRKDYQARIESGENMSSGVIKRVKVYVGCKHKIQVGDKMAGRHGNKGIVAKIVPVEDMPFLEDGRPVDIILNPLGVPSRMNVGQVLETHLGWAAKMLGIKVATPVFDGIQEEQIIDLMKQANAKVSKEDGVERHWGFRRTDSGYVYDGKTDLYDGRTGDPFDQRVLVGYVYMLKLDHLVAHKIHARAVGPYSLVTQQPLGGKAQHGGQRFGEMEVWALEAYGAAYNLQEMLTVKSDDQAGRARIYESIVKGQNVLEAGRPESFNVLLKEMQSLGLDIRTVKKSND